MTIQKYLDPKNDLAFKRIFGSEKNKYILIHFLNDALQKKEEEKIEEIEFIKNTFDALSTGLKSTAIDVLCKDKKGIQYIVEMQVANVRGFEKRAQYYAANIYCSQMKSGEKYEKLKEVIFLAIVDFVMFPDKEGYISDHVILDKNTYERDLKDFSFTFIELPKFKKTKVEELENYLEKWCYFFKNSDNEEGMSQLVGEEDKILEKAYDELKSFNWTKEELSNYEAMQKHIRDAIAREDFVREEGKIEGKIEGKSEREAEIVLSMLKENMDTPLISRLTGLSEEEIKKIKEQI